MLFLLEGVLVSHPYELRVMFSKSKGFESQGEVIVSGDPHVHREPGETQRYPPSPELIGCVLLRL